RVAAASCRTCFQGHGVAERGEALRVVAREAVGVQVIDVGHCPWNPSSRDIRDHAVSGSFLFLLRAYRKSQWLAPCLIVCVRVSCTSALKPSAMAKSALHTNTNPSSGAPISL